MNKQNIIFSLLMFTLIFSISLISSVVYQTPGYVPVQESIPSEVPVQEDSTKRISTFWIFVIVLAFMVLVFFVFGKRTLKRRKKIKSNLTLSEVYEREEKSFEEPKNETEKLQEEADKEMEKEANEILIELGLDGVNETKEVEEDEH